MKSACILATATVVTAQIIGSPYGARIASPVTVSPYGLAAPRAAYGGYGLAAPAYGGYGLPYGGYAAAPVRYTAPVTAPVVRAPAAAPKPVVEKKSSINPMLMYFLMDRDSGDGFDKNDDGTYSKQDDKDDMLMMMMMGGMYGQGSGMDLLTYKLLKGDKYVVDVPAGTSGCTGGSAGCSAGIGGVGVTTSTTYKLDNDNDDLFMIYAMNGLSGPAAGEGTATGSNMLLPLLLLDKF